MLEATLWGLVAASSLLIGALLGVYARLPQWVTGLILAFGAGALISAVSVELAVESFELGGLGTFAVGLAAGALVFFAADSLVARHGGKPRQSSAAGDSEEQVGWALLIGSVIDGIPESAVIGLSLLETGKVGIAILAAVFVSNLPEGVGGGARMERAIGAPRFFGYWALVVAVCALAAGLGYAFLDGASDRLIGFIQAFAAGGLLTMLAAEMVPSASADASSRGAPALAARAVGLVTVLGFAVAFGLSSLE